MVPPPAACFQAKNVESLCLFKKDIKPMWEDPANETGGEYQCRQSFELHELDILWEALVCPHHDWLALGS